MGKKKVDNGQLSPLSQPTITTSDRIGSRCVFGLLDRREWLKRFTEWGSGGMSDDMGNPESRGVKYSLAEKIELGSGSCWRPFFAHPLPIIACLSAWHNTPSLIVFLSWLYSFGVCLLIVCLFLAVLRLHSRGSSPVISFDSVDVLEDRLEHL